MEFFEFADIPTNEEVIRKKLTIDNLPAFCDEIDAVDATDGMGRVIFFLEWGRFHIQRDDIMGGVRFSVLDCPNALCWSVSTGHGSQAEKVTLHATINQFEQDKEFIAATRALLNALKNGIQQNLHRQTIQPPGPQSMVLPDLRAQGDS
ncbi:MAG: hypothetical protein KKI15_16330 [Proteobacteria bacterium]|nr:hypothetical protein [Pseudomonadota bacterium]